MQRSLTRDRANNATQKALKTPDIEALDIVVQDRIETFCSRPEGEQDSEVKAHGLRRKVQFKDIGYKSASVNKKESYWQYQTSSGEGSA